MKRLYFLAVCWLAALVPAFSQAVNCTQTLRLIRTTYEQGRLHELPNLAAGCLKGEGTNGFSKEEKKEAYRYLTLSYIYMEEPEKADESMVQLLNTDHFYQPNKEVDPAEFIALYNKFRHDPVWRLGGKFGANLTQPVVTNYYNVGSEAAGQGAYSMGISYQLYATFSKDFFRKKPWNSIVLVGEVGYVNRSYSYSNDQLATADEDPTLAISNQTSAFTQSFVDVNIIGQYKFKNTVDLQTYVGAGPGFSYLLSSSNQASTLLGNGFTITGSAVDDTESYNKLLISATLVAGVKYRFGEVYVTAEARYQMGFTNMINPSARTNPEVAFDYQERYNDYRINSMMICIGVIYPHFKPLKLIR